MRPRTNSETERFARSLRKAPSEAEVALWYEIRRGQVQGVRFRRQVPIGPYVADFACLPLKLVIELDGGQHSDALDYDAQRTSYLEKHGFRVLRFWNNQVFTERPVVLDAIWYAVEERQR
jgi:very-short-patch-repair endonuclease